MDFAKRTTHFFLLLPGVPHANWKQRRRLRRSIPARGAMPAGSKRGKSMRASPATDLEQELEPGMVEEGPATVQWS